MRINIKLICIAILLSLISCSKDDDNCLKYEPEYALSVDSPTSGKINQVISIEVKFAVYNGCGRLSKFKETNMENIFQIEIEAKYDGCFCTQNIPIRTVQYEFLTQSAGNYILNFKSNESEFITVNLTID